MRLKKIKILQVRYEDCIVPQSSVAHEDNYVCIHKCKYEPWETDNGSITLMSALTY